MATRPVFVACESGASYVQTHEIEFQWFPGMALKQAQRSVASLHDEAKKRHRLSNILEISSKSNCELGVKLSAFNLSITTIRHERTFSVECAYQSSKVFQHGGPFLDLLDAKSIDAKRDPRLNQSGRLTKYRFFGTDWDLEPRTAFYDWLYMNALHKQDELASEVLRFDAFSDIAFNPERSINCQAYSAALYVSLSRRGLLTTEMLKNREFYLEVVERATAETSREAVVSQERLAL